LARRSSVGVDRLPARPTQKRLAAPERQTNADGIMTLFEKLIAREIPASIVYEDDLVFAFNDINPQAPTHILIVPKKPLARIAETGDEDEALLGHLLLKAREVAKKVGLTPDGFRLVINNGKNGGESVPHLHCHILGGRPMSWPPG
jgi:histidine triad (HIT) family protein